MTPAPPSPWWAVKSFSADPTTRHHIGPRRGTDGWTVQLERLDHLVCRQWEIGPEQLYVERDGLVTAIIPLD